MKPKVRDFNPHTRVGCDQEFADAANEQYDFNPHTRVGCDAHWLRNIAAGLISIHTPAWGVTA